MTAILSMHHALLSHRPALEHEAGKYRHEQVWIGTGNASPRLAEFVAPHHDRIPGAIQDLIRADAAAWKVLPALVGQPVVNTKYLMTALGLGEMAALRALDALTGREVLVEITGNSRGRVWQHRGVLAVLDAYAADIRRMSIR